MLAAFYLREYARQGAFVQRGAHRGQQPGGVPSIVFGVFGVGLLHLLRRRHDRPALLPRGAATPTFGTGGILWASLTLALLTVPVVIVATEEGLAAIPRGMREASLALGATKLETTLRVVLPAVMPSHPDRPDPGHGARRRRGGAADDHRRGQAGARAAGRRHLPFLHLDRKFMHLGFHIYDVGFQSPNVDAAGPMVFTTTLLLLADRRRC